MLQRAKLKRARKIQFVIAFLAIATAMSVSASAQTTKTMIQAISPWSSCAACAGAGGAGPSASLATGIVSSPSLTGKARVFQIASTHSYADALWWKQLGAVNTAHNLVYDLYFYIKNPSASQALEFDSNQANGRKRWIFGTECSIGGGVWKVWGNANGNWISTGIPCKPPTAYKWHHLTWEFKRTDSGTLTFVAMTYDGVKHYVNRTYWARASWVNELNVAFQMDQRANHVTYQTWLDKVSLKYW
jgi:hypothetical protein